jgi:hypothetical protein
MKKFVLAIMITAGSIGSAQAWGDREQGALAGLFIGALMQKAWGQPQSNGYPPVQQGLPQQYPVHTPQPQPQIIIQAPPVIYTSPMRQHCEYVPMRSPYGHYYGERYMCRLVPAY